MTPQSWTDKISNHAQLGGIETSVIDNGAGRGTRIAWINTGTGLRYKVVIDRAMDIADAFYNQHSIGWLSHLGITPPQPFSNHAADWLRTFGGGLLVTCGLEHFGPPEKDEFGERGVHGLISNTPAEIESVIQPDPVAGKMDMSITGRIKQTQIFGPSFELRRTISGTLGKSSIIIHDEVMNRGNVHTPHMLLYHFNFGWPLIDEGTEIIWKGKWQPAKSDSRIFKEGENFRICRAPMEAHNAGGEDVGFIDIDADAAGMCAGGLYNRNLDLGVVIRFPKKQLPWLNNWLHFSKGEYVVGVEPATNPVIGQSKAREQKQLIMLQPGETLSYDVEMEVLDNSDGRIDGLLKG